MSPIKVYAVEAYAEPFDESPEAIFTVAARDESEAIRLVKQHEASRHYKRLAATVYDASGVIAFERVHSGR